MKSSRAMRPDAPSGGLAERRKVLAIAGSLRRDSFNRRLLEAAAACAPDGIAVQVYRALGELPPFDEDAEARALESGPVRELCEQVAVAEALLIATPEYNHSIPGVLKNAIDWLSRPGAGEVLAGKPVAIVGASSGSWGTRLAQAALRQTLFATESRVVAAPALYVAQAQRLFDERGRLIDERTRAALREILLALIAVSAPRRAPPA